MQKSKVTNHIINMYGILDIPLERPFPFKILGIFRSKGSIRIWIKHPLHKCVLVDPDKIKLLHRLEPTPDGNTRKH